MHYDVKYNIDTDGRKACLDTLQYIGKEKYKMLARAIKYGLDETKTEIALMLTGVQGFPVKAMQDRYSRKLH